MKYQIIIFADNLFRETSLKSILYVDKTQAIQDRNLLRKLFPNKVIEAMEIVENEYIKAIN